MSPRTPEQFEAIRQQRTKDIINAALRLFGEKGFEATSITAIAREAGIAKGLLYNYFESKEHLMEEVILEGFRAIVPSLDDLKLKKQSPGKALRQMLESTRDSVKSNPKFWQLYIRMFFQISANDRLEKIFLKYTQTYFQAIRELLVDLGVDNPDIEIWKLGAQLDGIVLDYTLIQDMAKNSSSKAREPETETWPEYPLDEVIESIIQQYTR